MRKVPPTAFSTAFVAWLAGILPTKPRHQQDSREFGHKAVEKGVGDNAKSGPKGLFYALVARLAGILPTKPLRQEDSGESGHKTWKSPFSTPYTWGTQGPASEPTASL